MLIKDGDLVTLLQQRPDQILYNYDEPKDWKSKESLVQPCSIDLHIGAIYQPGIKAGDAGSAGAPKSQLVLKTGQTAILTTKECIHLPGNYAGIGFPPSHVSSQGLLMTNPGHVDPGYKGQLQFTVINMGRDDYPLRANDQIVTVLIFKLEGNVDADYSARTGAHASHEITQADIDRLSPDFVDVQKRATDIATKILGYASIGATVLAIILGWAFNLIDKRLEGIDEMKVKLTQLDDANNNLTKQLQDAKDQFQKQLEIDRRLRDVESRVPKGTSR